MKIFSLEIICKSSTKLIIFQSGHQPAVRVWNVEEKSQVSELHGHQFGINCVVSVLYFVVVNFRFEEARGVLSRAKGCSHMHKI